MTLSEYNTCVDAFADGLYRFALKNVKDEDWAKDIVQESFAKTWEKVESISFEKAKTYLFTAVYHTSLDWIKKEKKKVQHEDHHPEPFHTDQYSDVQEVLQKGIDQLPEIQKNVLLLRDYEGYDYQEIGKIMNLNESQVKVYIYRARKFLQEYIGKKEVLI